MKNVTLKLISLAMVISLLLSLVSCGASGYIVVGMYKGSVSNMSEMGFVSLVGRVNIGVNNTYTQDTCMSVSASLEGGEVEIYYRTDIMPDEVLAFKLSAGEEKTVENFGYLTNGEDAVFFVVAPEGVTAEGFKMTVKVNEPLSSATKPGGEL